MHIRHLLWGLQLQAACDLVHYTNFDMREHDVLGRVGPPHGWTKSGLLAVRARLTQGGWKYPDIISRSFVFVMLGASGFAPIIHALVSDHISVANFPLFHILTSSILYLIGTAFYLTRTPEKYWPDMFDVWVSESCQDESNNANWIFSGRKPSNLSYPY